jgi:hypothetical protein
VCAKINGFPYWPAKVLRSLGGTHLDVRFFGAHDRAVVPVEKCMWLSDEMPERPNSQFNKSLRASFDEVEIHLLKLEQQFGAFTYARKNTPVDLDNVHVFFRNENGEAS